MNKINKSACHAGALMKRDPRNLLQRLHDWWNPPCPRHPLRRTKEVDTELASRCSMFPGPAWMCRACWEEYNDAVETGNWKRSEQVLKELEPC